MVYALAEMVDDAETVMEFADEHAAELAFRGMCVGLSRRWAGIVSMWLFSTREYANAAIGSDPHEIEVDESWAYKVLEWERAYGKNGFTSRAPES